MKFRNSTRFTHVDLFSLGETCFPASRERERGMTDTWSRDCRWFARDLFHDYGCLRPSPWIGSHDLHNAEDYGRRHFLLFAKGEKRREEKRDSDNTRFVSRGTWNFARASRSVYALCILATNRRFREGGIEGLMQINETAYLTKNSPISAI